MSPIVGLTDRPSRLPRIGTIHKGAPKPERGPGRDLNYFRLASEDPDLMMAWESAFGDKPTSFPVYLAYDDPDNSFDTSREEFVAGGLIHRCDGETCQIRLIDGKNYSREPAPCPYAQTKYTDPRERPCKPIGKLRVIVPELRRIGVLELGTHSLHDIISLSSNISLYALLARQAGRPLSGIPFILSRREREISTPSGTTGRARRKVSLVSLDIDPRWAAVQLASRERDLALETANTPLMLPQGTPEELTDPDDEVVPLMPRPSEVTAGKRDTVVKTPDIMPANGVKKQSPLAIQTWRDLVNQIPEQGMLAYFIPPELPADWTSEEVKKGGTALRDFAAAWKKMAKPDELTTIAEAIVAIRKAHGEEMDPEALF